MDIPPLSIAALIHMPIWGTVAIALMFLFKKHKTKAYFISSLAFICATLWSPFMAAAFYYKSELCLRVTSMFFGLALFFASWFIDLIWYEKPTITRMTIVSTNVAVTFITMWLPDAIIYITLDGYEIPYWGGVFRYSSLLSFFLGAFFIFHTLIVLWRKLPLFLKRKMWPAIPGMLIIFPGSIFSYIYAHLAGISITTIIGLVIVGYAGLKNPQIMYMLPFRVHRLIIVHQNSGICIYDYPWSKSETSDVLLAGLIKALSSFGKEVLDKGIVQEIKLNNGILIIEEGTTIMTGLFASNTSNYLHDCMKNLTVKFEEIFKTEIENDYCHRDCFDQAKNLVKEVFSNIPIEYD